MSALGAVFGNHLITVLVMLKQKKQTNALAYETERVNHERQPTGQQTRNNVQESIHVYKNVLADAIKNTVVAATCPIAEAPERGRCSTFHVVQSPSWPSGPC